MFTLHKISQRVKNELISTSREASAYGRLALNTNRIGVPINLNRTRIWFSKYRL